MTSTSDYHSYFCPYVSFSRVSPVLPPSSPLHGLCWQHARAHQRIYTIIAACFNYGFALYTSAGELLYVWHESSSMVDVDGVSPGRIQLLQHPSLHALHAHQHHTHINQPYATLLAAVMPSHTATNRTTLRIFSFTLEKYIHVLKFKSPIVAIHTSPAASSPHLFVLLNNELHVFMTPCVANSFTLTLLIVHSLPVDVHPPLSVSDRVYAHAAVLPSHAHALTHANTGAATQHTQTTQSIASKVYNIGEAVSNKAKQYVQQAISQGCPLPPVDDPSLSVPVCILIRDLLTHQVLLTVSVPGASPPRTLSFDLTGVLMSAATRDGQYAYVWQIVRTPQRKWKYKQNNPSTNNSRSNSPHISSRRASLSLNTSSNSPVSLPSHPIPYLPHSSHSARLLFRLFRGITHAEILSLTFSPCSNWLAATSAKGTVHVWAVDPYVAPSTQSHYYFSSLNTYRDNQAEKAAMVAAHDVITLNSHARIKTSGNQSNNTTVCFLMRKDLSLSDPSSLQNGVCMDQLLIIDRALQLTTYQLSTTLDPAKPNKFMLHATPLSATQLSSSRSSPQPALTHSQVPSAARYYEGEEGSVRILTQDHEAPYASNHSPLLAPTSTVDAARAAHALSAPLSASSAPSSRRLAHIELHTFQPSPGAVRFWASPQFTMKTYETVSKINELFLSKLGGNKIQYEKAHDFIGMNVPSASGSSSPPAVAISDVIAAALSSSIVLNDASFIKRLSAHSHDDDTDQDSVLMLNGSPLSIDDEYQHFVAAPQTTINDTSDRLLHDNERDELSPHATSPRAMFHPHATASQILSASLSTALPKPSHPMSPSPTISQATVDELEQQTLQHEIESDTQMEFEEQSAQKKKKKKNKQKQK